MEDNKMNKNFLNILSILIFLTILIGCSSTDTPDRQSPGNSINPTKSVPDTTTSKNHGAESIEGEFVVINVYRTTAIDYYRAVLTDDDKIVILMNDSGVLFSQYYSTDTGLLSGMSVYLADEKINVSLDSKEYAWNTSLEQIKLKDGILPVYIGHTGINIKVSGKELGLSNC